MFTLLAVIFFLFIIFALLRILFGIVVVLKKYLNGEIQLSIEEKQEMKKSFWEGIKLVVRHLFLFK